MMRDQRRAAVVGGSIAGCAAAVALRRAGCMPEVYERSGSGLRARGAGIAMPASLRDEAIAVGYIDAAMPVLPCRRLVFTVRDGEDPTGRVIGVQPFSAYYTNWGVLWRELRRRVPDEIYHLGTPVVDANAAGEDAVIEVEGRRERFDVVVGADGYRSMLRGKVDAEAGLVDAGYILWRGDYPEDLLPDPRPSLLTGGGVMVGFPSGHGGFYLIPGLEGGGNRMNWAVYGPAPSGLRAEKPGSMPRGRVDDAMVADLESLLESFPPYWAEVIRRTPRGDLSIQLIYDVKVAAYASGRALLAGDAGALARPHTGAGAVKALQDAMALEAACRTYDTWEDALAAYDAERRTAGNALTDLGRRLGRDRVLETPDWAALTPEEFEAWWRGAVPDARRNPYALDPPDTE
ncbi:hypothetical protein J4573_16810 [Actinomadura barringtoniae]|uniref:Monooxygenase n=1 Tax=Actinomadura barringtoniae TaxID=1427535 RepID=A0A939P9Z6_9ACTN|nr:hypothetical protein [Actinomadura barringtoniae]MBO2448766.1 hypothetical protein [Actinomadura barringtoniae]